MKYDMNLGGYLKFVHLSKFPTVGSKAMADTDIWGGSGGGTTLTPFILDVVTDIQKGM
jgi:hypothetical protein